MRKPFSVFFAILALAVSASASRWEAGILYGARGLKNADMRGIFGGGASYSPFMAVRISEGGWVEISYEGGFDRKARVGLFEDLFQLRVTGVEIFYRREWRVGAFSPYVKLGPGVAYYKIHIDSPFLTAYNVKGKDISFALAFGLKARLLQRIFLAGELKYGVLWIDPYDDKLDLGGFRAQVGIGFSL